MKIITIVDDFSRSPYRRKSAEVPSGEEDTTGENFRKTLLTPALHANDKVKVVLTGYNRYARSFLDEAFGGLIREDGFTYDDLKNRLSYEHASVKSIELLIAERIEKAAKDMGQLNV
ncbi:STAS-like domain-containing protein [Histophilus somni]|uniref:DUF4325 domain-containing protein n=1 Tax=Histophilus somni TaxID=731 RepID=A0AAX2RXA2_HISSO|nr:STAS-like domain-containing protein [Histophilus somni]TDF37982.1 DUF4325 domain-containing protein [Histophilus somni]TEW27313.1 DUF4325 domain-containing protein [Histophilus somni]THA20801.1 DUF4325 domain-containing protein [Histophilus somni]THA89293.1 DUF4325 domain-containing protein [Histophilus somni]TJY48097.1 DUF4325 domain-containing protein [Histophilus somni]